MLSVSFEVVNSVILVYLRALRYEITRKISASIKKHIFMVLVFVPERLKTPTEL